MKSIILSQFESSCNRMGGTIGGITMISTLDQVCKGLWTQVTSVDTSIQLRRRLRDFGLVPGTRVRCRYASPAGDVLAIELRGSVVALRKQDAHRISVRL